MPVTIGGPKNISMLVLVAQKQGFFEQRGVDVAYQPLQNGTITFEAVKSGQIDLGILVDANLAFIGFEGLQGVTAIASVMEKTDDSIIARTDRGIHTPADLRGRRIGYLPGTSSNMLLRRFAEANNIDLSEATLVALSPPAMQTALINGDVDAISVWQPYGFNVLSKLGNDGIRFPNRGVYYANVFMVARANALAERTQAFQRVLQALIDAEAYVAKNPKESITFLSGAIGVDREDLRRAWGEYNMRVRLDTNADNSLTNLAHVIVDSGPKFSGRDLPIYEGAVTPDILVRVDAKRVQ
ncbi:ABC transporter substrate-binding protein [Legionella yabuuchiae]|uniref:ABC transporter substrate-binding protein n=1 Tax=Legionella yabuuchiae TaxID=376727 RepID=UPI0013EF8CEE|nr:NrtA/SsuA/CpmA family ABC transporter substrate-binding protein [Legionella yabuuchiae]